MKLIYCTHSLYNPGGMERVLLNKVAWLRAHTDWEILIITTDQKQRPAFYPVAQGVRQIDLGINYSDYQNRSVIKKIIYYLRKRKRHREKLSKLLMKENADVVVSLYPSESSFIPKINDGSKKILELHFNKAFRLQYGRKGIVRLIDYCRTKEDERIVRQFDKFVVLTKEDREYWGDVPGIEVIPNAAMFRGGVYSYCLQKRIIAVGRLDYQKGFDRLIQAWEFVQKNADYNDWRLDIFGQGEWHDMLQQMIIEKGLSNTLRINKPTNAIWDEYANSSILVMTSNYEGFGMVIVEAMACGVPAIAFDCKCGPKDIIRHGENGLLVKNGDIEGLAEAMMRLMMDEPLRRKMSRNARNVVETYSEDSIMQKWMNLFVSLTEN